MTFDDQQRLQRRQAERGMLMLARKVGQRVMIGDDIIITVSGVEFGTVTLGIQCPRHISVDREEVRKLKDGAGQQASGPADEKGAAR